ncbi:MAG: hypothetical protein R3F45_11465 [Gammaproteobacteria bacterium]
MKTRSKAAVVGVTLSCAVLTGCTGGSYSTTETSTVGGAAVGALVGGLLGGWQWAAIGAASGAALGWVTGKAIEAQEISSRSTVQDQQLYGYSAPSDSVFVNINSATSSPQVVAPGGVVDVVTDYSLALPQSMSQANVLATSVLMKDGEKVMEFKGQPVPKSSGGYTIKLPINIPAEAAPGTYVIEHSVSSGSTYDTAQSTFIVKS